MPPATIRISPPIRIIIIRITPMGMAIITMPIPGPTDFLAGFMAGADSKAGRVAALGMGAEVAVFMVATAVVLAATAAGAAAMAAGECTEPGEQYWFEKYSP
jgi:hypothetical protein